MGWLGHFSSRKKAQIKEDTEREGRDKVDIILEAKRQTKGYTKIERLTLIRENQEQISESFRQIEEAKVEYQAVTSYLGDIQKIDMIPLEQRKALEDAARMIVNLTKERERFRGKSSFLSDIQYRIFEQYQLQLPRDMEAIREAEEYQKAINHDIEQLEGEKQRLMEEEKEIGGKHSFLKGIAKTTGVLVLLLFVLFAVLSNYSGANLTLPFLMTVLMGMASTLYIYLEARRNQSEIRMVEKKANRAITLLNKVKIKSVNNRQYLDYILGKYMVESYDDLKNRWEEYIKLKDELKRYQNNTELLEFNNRELIHELNLSGVKDSEVWIYQANAIIDNREMVEVRHRLNVRRQKLRDRINSCNQQREEAVASITEIAKLYPDCEAEVAKIMKDML